MTKKKNSTFLEKENRHFNDQNYDEAIRCHTEIIRITDDIESRALAFYNRVVAYKNKNNYEKVITDYNKAIELKPNYARTYVNRGNLFYDIKRHNETIADIKKGNYFSKNVIKMQLQSASVG